MEETIHKCLCSFFLLTSPVDFDRLHYLDSTKATTTIQVPLASQVRRFLQAL